MKKKLRSVIAMFLAFTMLFSVSASAATEVAKDHNKAIRTVTDIVGGIIDGAISFLGEITPTPSYPTVDEYFGNSSDNFYVGTKEFIDEPAKDAKWSLGFGRESLVPENLKNGTKEYYTGGYFTQTVNGVYDDQRAIAIALNDGSGRGTTIFAAIDGIGVGNADIRSIRSEVERKLEKIGLESDINAININATHCHTVVDTQGIGIDLIGKILRSFFTLLPYVDQQRSIDLEFLDVMIDKTSDAIVEAYLGMEKGELYYFESVGIGKDEAKGTYLDDEYSYLHNKRYDTEGYQHTWACFKFVPDNPASKPTIFSNIGAHPTTIDRSTTLVSADFPYYMEEKINANGMNFMFIQGAQSPISVNKGGVKTKSVLDEVNAIVSANPAAANYQTPITLGYEYARLILEAQSKAKKVEPILNVKMKEYRVKLDTGLFQYGATEGFIGTTTVRDYASKTGYSIITEAGYIEIGKDIVILTAPGELIPQLVYGNVVSAKDSYLGTEWGYPATVTLIPNNKTVLVMGLCNDAIGYIIPDNDYAHFIADSLWSIDGAEKIFGPYHRHYEELLATGGSAASSTIVVLNGLAKELNK